ncbi:hypothetical protein [Arthrobacter sp. FW306-2-2C-D06B]|uniref:hypothetical protein n=1 Tax=Arthrobacter sp. FW306-2-2C-D06B TaxID=2879618 RepID=UPI001F3DD8AD|nr:hypothetical protein [Arthrobacter sp. FW306-2-2C-D06B]UKA57516.1 hypothetical protein LFT47_14600 [Arthrobacter sp. FW306-2-2C-D06B]
MTTTPAHPGDEPGKAGAIAIPADDYRRVIALARALTTADVEALAALQPMEPGQAHAMMLAAVTVIAALASDDRLDGAEAELQRVLASTLKLEGNQS